MKKQLQNFNFHLRKITPMTKTVNAIGMTRAHNCNKVTVQEKAQPQKASIKKYCLENNIDLLKIINCDTNDFVRKDEWLIDLIKHIEEQKSKIDMIIFYSWDRITRTDCGSIFHQFLNYCNSKNIKLYQTLRN